MKICEDRQVLTYSHDCSKAGATKQVSKLTEKLVESEQQVYLVQEEPSSEKLVYVQQQPQVEHVEQSNARHYVVQDESRSEKLEYAREYAVEEDPGPEKQYSRQFVIEEEPRSERIQYYNY